MSEDWQALPSAIVILDDPEDDVIHFFDGMSEYAYCGAYVGDLPETEDGADCPDCLRISDLEDELG